MSCIVFVSFSVANLDKKMQIGKHFERVIKHKVKTNLCN